VIIAIPHLARVRASEQFDVHGCASSKHISVGEARRALRTFGSHRAAAVELICASGRTLAALADAWRAL
jgi:hypothetical protein